MGGSPRSRTDEEEEEEEAGGKTRSQKLKRGLDFRF